MTSPTGQQRPPLQVDIQQVIEHESHNYTSLIAGLVRDNSVLQVALRNREDHIAELEARVMALGGASAVPGRPPMPTPRPSGGPSPATVMPPTKPE